jgi:hypothetical protein
MSWGRCSIRVYRRNEPTWVSKPRYPVGPVSLVMRNLTRDTRRPSGKRRGQRQNTGPELSSLIASATKAKSGKVSRPRAHATTISPMRRSRSTLSRRDLRPGPLTRHVRWKRPGACLYPRLLNYGAMSMCFCRRLSQENHKPKARRAYVLFQQFNPPAKIVFGSSPSYPLNDFCDPTFR